MSELTTFANHLEPWIRQYSVVLIAFFGVGVLVLLIVSTVARRRLTVAARRIATLPELAAAEAVNGATEETYTELLALVDGLPDQGGRWWLAVRPTIEGYARRGNEERPGVGYFVTERIDETVGASSTGEGWTAFVHAIPGVLTSMGLLGTFVALLIGLQGLEPNSEGVYNLSGLISNLSGKFVTSIVALSLSVLFVLLELAARATVANARLRLVQALSRVLPFLSPTHLLLDMRAEGVRQTKALSSLRRGVRQQLEGLASLGRSSADQVSMLSSMHTTAGVQATWLGQIKSVSDRTATQLERFNTDLAVSIGTAMDANIVPVLKSLLESTNELHKVQAGLGEELLKEVGAKISGAVSGAAGEEMRAVSTAINDAATTLKTATDAMKEGQDKLVSATSAIIDQINNVFGENAKRLHEDTASAVRGVVTQIDSAAGAFSSKIGDAGSTVSAALLQTSENLRSIVGQCERIVKNTDASVQRFNALVDTVSGATRDIAAAHAALRATSEPLGAVATRTALLIDSLNQQVTVIGQSAASLKATSENVHQVQTTLEASWRGYETRFADVDRALASSLTQMRGGFDLYAEKIQALNSGLDEHLAKALSDLSGVVNELHETVEDMQSASNGRRTR